jgi:glycosyltransferase involved in cell wall biosynthesis
VSGTSQAGRRKLAYVAYAFPVLTQTFTVREVAALRRRGVDVDVFAVRGDAAARLDPESAEESARATRLSGGEAAAAALAWLVRRPLRFLATLATCLSGGYRDQALACRLRAPFHFVCGAALASRLAADGGFGAIHAQFLDAGSTVAYVASRLLDMPFSVANHTAYNPFLLRAKARRARRLVSISEYDRGLLVRECGPSVEGKTAVSRVGIAPAEWAETKRVPETGRVLSVGALREKKGHDVLLRAAALLAARERMVTVRIVGAGPEEASLRSLAASLGVDATFLGAASPSTVREEMSRAAAFALACRVARNGDLDGIPVALMEAMAAGVPVVSTRLSGIPELVEDGVCGLLAAPGDPASLADALERLLADAPLAASLATAARRRVAELHDIERTSAELARLIAPEAA